MGFPAALFRKKRNGEGKGVIHVQNRVVKRSCSPEEIQRDAMRRPESDDGTILPGLRRRQSRQEMDFPLSRLQ